MTDRNEKYVVFKREDWDEMIQETKDLALPGNILPPACGPLVRFGENREVPDAVVIRRQDVFAGPALAAYANSIQLAVRVANLNDTIEPNATALRLSAIADYFHEQSILSDEEHFKMPD